MVDIHGRPTTGRPKKGDSREGRTKQLSIRLSDSDLRDLNRLASFYGVTKTDYILMMIEEGMKDMRKYER